MWAEWSCGHRLCVGHDGPEAGLGVGGRDVPNRLEQASAVEPVDPFERGELDGLEAAPWSTTVDDLGLVEAVDGFGQGVIVAVANAASRGLEPGFGQTLGVFDRNVPGLPRSL